MSEREYATCNWCGVRDYSECERNWEYVCAECRELPMADACDACGEYRGKSALLLQVAEFERRNKPYGWPEERTNIIDTCDVCAPVAAGVA